MPYVTDVDDVRFMLEVYECECGYHIGLDVSYADQVGEVTVECPSCKLPITSHMKIRREIPPRDDFFADGWTSESTSAR